jgi:carboxyl-terminal processing protease
VLPTATTAPTSRVSPKLPESGETENDPLGLLEEVWQLLSREYYGDLPSPEDRTYGAIRGMLSTLDDDYTSFSEPTIAEILRTDASGSFEGIGAFVALNEEDILEIAQVFEDSPADQAGLQAGDQILAVDGESIIGYGVYDAISLIRGPEGSQVLLSIQRDELDPFDVAITRARLMIPITEAEMLENNVGYVSLVEFSSQAADRLEQELEGLLAQGATALIFDLRGNPGGFLGQAVDVADLFLDDGLVLIERRSDGEVREFESTSGGPAESIPLVVLVNGESASASEIVAGAIHDRARGTIIGETTLGKGSVQMVHTLSDGSELRVTFARWFTPNDRAIHGQGLAPDIEVVLTAQDAEEGLDPQLQRALEYLATGK